MKYIIAVLGLTLLLAMLWDAFETIILPRRVTRRFRFARFFYRLTWRLRSGVAQSIRDDKRRETYLSIFGPLSLLLLLAVWAAGLVAGFGILHFGLESRLNVAGGAPSFSTYLYMSGTTLFTLGLGDVTPQDSLGRVLVVVEAGVGLGFLAAVISYLPILYQAFSRREVGISLLDARAGSPPSAGELLRRCQGDMPGLNRLLYDWERWSAQLLESHLSYPVLAYYRSQHTNQSWLAALTAILDTCALTMAGVDGGPIRQAELTFAMARHAAVDLAQMFIASPQTPKAERLPTSSLTALRSVLAEAGVSLQNGSTAERKLREFRQMYEPYVQALSEYFSLALPSWSSIPVTRDNWKSSPWEVLLTKVPTPTSSLQPRVGQVDLGGTSEQLERAHMPRQ